MIATGAGIVCAACGGNDMQVVDSRPGDGYIRRRRKCEACSARVTTVETVIYTRSGVDISTLRAFRLQSAIDAMPGHKREIVLSLVAAFAADEVKP